MNEEVKTCEEYVIKHLLGAEAAQRQAETDLKMVLDFLKTIGLMMLETDSSLDKYERLFMFKSKNMSSREIPIEKIKRAFDAVSQLVNERGKEL